MSGKVHVLRYGDHVKFIGGKYNGFEGIVQKVCGDGNCSVAIDYENKLIEVVEHFGFFKLLKAAEGDYTHDINSVSDDAAECHNDGFFSRLRKRLFSS